MDTENEESLVRGNVYKGENAGGTGAKALQWVGSACRRNSRGPLGGEGWEGAGGGAPAALGSLGCLGVRHGSPGIIS